MRVFRLAVSVRLALLLVLSGSLVGGLALPVAAQEESASDEFLVLDVSGSVERHRRDAQPNVLSDELNAQLNDLESEVPIANAEIPQLSELEQPATTVTDWMAQIEASIVQITNVRIEATEAGLQVILETENGVLDVPETRSIGNALIADIPNATIAEEFSQAEPIEGIALVNVTQLPGDRVRVAITGTDATPVAEVTSEVQELAFAVTLGDAGTAAEEDAIQVVVTGEQDEGYNPSRASTATRTDTPLRDIPQSIQVVPRQVIEDRRPRTVLEAVETVSGVLNGSNDYGAPGGTNIIRGFVSFDSGNLRNGFREYDYYSVSSIGTVEQIEVLRGPASVLFGAQEPGGVINVITRQPLEEPYYNLAFEAGNYGFYQPGVDLSGPLTTDGDVLYRFIASYQGAESYQDFVDSGITTIAPSIALRLGDQTNLNLYYEYVRYFSNNPPFEVPLLSDGSLPPQNFYPAYPDLVAAETVTNRLGFTLDHEFNANWQIRSNLAIVFNNRIKNINNASLFDDRTVQIFYAEEASSSASNYFGQIDLLGRFNTGSISHQILAGFDVNYFELNYQSSTPTTSLPNLDIFDPNYDISRPEYGSELELYQPITSYGVYLQDQIAFSDNLRLLIGGRYDWVSSEFEILSNEIDERVQSDGAFSPRIGLVYQPSDTVSLYASYSRSFKPSSGFNPDGEAFEPTRGTQYEVGTRVDFLEGRLSANLAAYHLTRSNITTPDPGSPGFSVQTGEARSQGIELDVTGEIFPGWNVILSYAYTDAEVTEDNTTPVGNRLANVPFNQASLWTTYTIQEGDLRGLGFGLGLFYIGERQSDLANTVELPSYLRTDAALYYRRDRFNAAINIRNLFDIDYLSYAFGNGGQRGAPFTISGSIGWTF
jgi:iron complex outermembrane recepter protein